MPDCQIRHLTGVKKRFGVRFSVYRLDLAIQAEQLRNKLRGSVKAKVILVVFITIVLSSCINLNLSLSPDNFRKESPYEYYIYVPTSYSVDDDWPVFVFIHGAGGSGKDCWNKFQRYSEKEGYILVCPSLSDAGGGWYQEDGNIKLLSILDQVYSEYSVRTQVFLSGFSAGGQFVQGFAFSYPENVAGVSVIAPGNIYIPTEGASLKPFYVMVGDLDTPDIVKRSQQLAISLEQYGYPVKYFLIPGIGHQMNDQEIDLTLELYRSLFP